MIILIYGIKWGKDIKDKSYTKFANQGNCSVLAFGTLSFHHALFESQFFCYKFNSWSTTWWLECLGHFYQQARPWWSSGLLVLARPQPGWWELLGSELTLGSFLSLSPSSFHTFSIISLGSLQTNGFEREIQIWVLDILNFKCHLRHKVNCYMRSKNQSTDLLQNI